MKKVLILLSVVFVAFSCEKVIDIPLNESDKKIVVEAVCVDRIGESKVLLSKTGSVYEQSVFDKINNATVTITDKNGVVTTFVEDGTSEGVYTHPTFVTEPNQVYDLKVVTEDDVFLAQSETKTFVPLGAVFYQKEPTSPFIQSDKDSIYSVYFSIVDNALEENHYRIKVTKNGKASSYLYIVEDQLFNGEEYVQPLFANSFDDNDTCFIEFLNIDKANYTYLTSKDVGQDGSATPANPVSNIEGGALGYFGAYLSDTVTVILPG